MIFHEERQLERGHAAWKRGELTLAREILEPLFDAAAPRLEVACPLARALHESGESERALELLELTLGPRGLRTGHARGGLVHRALIDYDLEDESSLAQDLEDMGPDNRFAASLRGLIAARAGAWTEARFPPMAPWTSETAGRLLEVLERQYAESREGKEDLFHPRLYSEGLAAAERVEEKPFDLPSPAKKNWKRPDWERALEESFCARRFEEFLALWEAKHVPDDWRASLCQDYWLVARVLSSKPEEALRTADDFLEREGPSVHAHYLRGLALLGSGERAPVAWAFTRAGLHDDLRLHGILVELSRELELELTYLAG